MRLAIFVATLIGLPVIAFADDLPFNPAVTQETIGNTICVFGWTKTVRPPVSFTNRVKIKLILELELPEELLRSAARHPTRKISNCSHGTKRLKKMQ